MIVRGLKWLDLICLIGLFLLMLLAWLVIIGCIFAWAAVVNFFSWLARPGGTK